MTSLAEIITEAMIYIDDVRMQEQLDVNPALFYRRLSDYVTAAMPLLSSPPELYKHIEKEYVPADYDDTAWVSTEQSMTEETVLDTGCIGYDLCSVVIRSEDGTYVSPYSDAVYDSETGTVTFPVQEKAGVQYEIDFYKDGSVADLTYSMKRLFGLAIAIVWDEKLDRNWLALTPKIRDSSFQTVNESNYMDKLSIYIKENRQRFQDELRKYEQTNAYFNVNLPKVKWTLN